MLFGALMPFPVSLHKGVIPSWAYIALVLKLVRVTMLQFNVPLQVAPIAAYVMALLAIVVMLWTLHILYLFVDCLHVFLEVPLCVAHIVAALLLTSELVRLLALGAVPATVRAAIILLALG